MVKPTKQARVYKYKVSQTNIKGVKHYSFTFPNLREYVDLYNNDNYDTDNVEVIKELSNELEALGIKFRPEVKNNLTLKIFGMYLVAMFKLHAFNQNKSHTVMSIALSIKHEVGLMCYYQIPIITAHREILKEVLICSEVKKCLPKEFA